MTRQLMNSTAYLIDEHVVTLTRLHNDANGNPRYQADIVSLKNLKACGCAIASRYTFRGHYSAEIEEARFILKQHMEE